MSAFQFLVTFFIGAVLAFAAGFLLGRRVRLVEDWKRLLAIGCVCFAIGGGVAALDAAVSAAFLIALALAWFGVLLCGFAGAHILSPVTVPQSPAADPDATLAPPPPPPAPDGRTEPS